jgi:hypothetical protein
MSNSESRADVFKTRLWRCQTIRRKMFRGILPRRAATPEFTMVTPGESLPNGGKENNPTRQLRSNRAVSVSKEKLEELGMDQAFNEMLVGTS